MTVELTFSFGIMNSDMFAGYLAWLEERSLYVSVGVRSAYIYHVRLFRRQYDRYQ